MLVGALRPAAAAFPAPQRPGKVQAGPEVKCASTWPGALVIFSHAMYDLWSQDMLTPPPFPLVGKWQLFKKNCSKMCIAKLTILAILGTQFSGIVFTL